MPKPSTPSVHGPDASGVSHPVQRVGRSGFGGCERLGQVPGGRPNASWASTRVSTGVPVSSGPAKTSTFRPGLPSAVRSADVGTGWGGRRKRVPGSKTTGAEPNCFWRPASAVVARDGVPL